ncbi:MULTISPECIES: hypothetical protein [Pirellulaceae]|nr:MULTISPECIES: hypothetical protein [Pirellulaceae]
MAVLEGRISWSSFFRVHLPAVLWLGVSIGLAAWSLFFEFRSQWIVAGFSLIVSTGSFLYLLISLSIAITWFRLEGDSLWFTQLGRFPRGVPLDHITSIHRTQPPREGLVVYLRGGYSLCFLSRSLENVDELGDVLAARLARSPKRLEGCLDRASAAQAVVTQMVLACLLIPLGLAGWFIMAVAFHPAKIGNPFVFLTLGVLLMGLVLTGFYFLVMHTWLGCVRWYSTTGQGFAYRTVFSRTEVHRLWSDIVSYTAHRPSTRRGRESTFGIVRFQDRSLIKLHLGMLQNVAPLVDEIKQRLIEQHRHEIPLTLRALDEEHPLWNRVAPHRQPGEIILWIGTADYQKIRSEAHAETAFGILVATFGIGTVAVLIYLGVLFGDVSFFIVACGFLVFGLIGAWSARAPWVIQRLLSQSVYAVTDRRLIVLDGLQWSEGHPDRTVRECVVTYTPEAVRRYEVVGDRHISLGGYWQRGRKRSQYWVHQGIFAPADLQEAERALRTLLSHFPDHQSEEIAGNLETL